MGSSLMSEYLNRAGLGECEGWGPMGSSLMSEYLNRIPNTVMLNGNFPWNSYETAHGGHAFLASQEHADLCAR